MSHRRRTARAIIIQDGKILAFERWRTDAMGKEFHYYSIPGGGIEDGESPEAAVQRELMEEMGVVISVGELLIRQTTDERYHYYFTCSIVSGIPSFQLDSPEAALATAHNTFAVAWVSLSGFHSSPFFPAYQHAIDAVMLLRSSPDHKSPIDISS
ncbi:NUDIX domain-containing protein [Pedobacter sp.]|nr:NUDIX domain-containing protein [Candidatus Saccharibacteria bacterium]